MAVFAYWSGWTLLGIGLAELIYALLFARLMRHAAVASRPEGDMPRVSVLLSVRGLDGGFAAALEELLTQDYPRYDVQIVVDNPSDPAWPLVHEAVARHPEIQVRAENLHHRLTTCSSKNSAILQLVETADTESEVYVFVDSDAEIHHTWLRELVAPLRDRRVGLTFGNRWYVPTDDDWGTLVRYVWNVLGVVPMHILRTPWGGSMALRAELVPLAHLREIWSQTIVDDAILRRAVLDAGKEIRFVPTVLVPNRHGLSLAASVNYIGRQLAWTRMYAPTVWWPIVVFSLINIVGLVGNGTAIVWAIAHRDMATLAWCGGISLVYQLNLIVLWGWLEHLARKVLLRNGRVPADFSLRRIAATVLTFPLVQGLHYAALFVAIFQRTFQWRGIIYRVHSPRKIEIISAPSASPDQHSAPLTVTGTPS